MVFIQNAHYKNEFNGFLTYFIYNFGGISMGETTSLFDVLFNIVPSIFVLYMFSHVMLDDFEINYIYVFTRLGKKSRWLNQKTGELFFKIVFTYLLLFLFAFSTGYLFGLRPFFLIPALFQAYLALFFCNVGAMFFFEFLLNVLSLRCGSAQAFLYTLILYIGSFVAALALYNKSHIGNIVLYFLPASNQMYLWHIESVPFTRSFYQNQLNGFRLLDSYVILFVYILSTYLVTYNWLEKRDTLEMIKEA